MIHKHTYKDFTWIDLESPDTQEVRKVMTEFDISPHIADELLVPSMKPHVDVRDKYMYLVLHFPALRRTHEAQEQEVDFIIGDKFLITTRYESIDTFHSFEKIFDVNATLEKDHLGDSAMEIFLTLTKRLYRSVEHEIDQVRNDLEDFEKEIFEGREREMVIALSRTGRDILNLKQSLDPHQDVWKSLDNAIIEFAGDDYKHRVRNIEDVYYRARKHVTRLWQTLTELRETNNSLLSTKQNEVMKIFTILAFVTFPLSLIASIFGMNTQQIPIVGSNNDFWIVMGLMAFATLLMFVYFRRKKWL